MGWISGLFLAVDFILMHPARKTLFKNTGFCAKSSFFLRCVGAAREISPTSSSLPLPLYLHLNQRNASGHSDALQKDMERKQTQFMTDADEDRQRQKRNRDRPDKSYSTTDALPICGCPVQTAATVSRITFPLRQQIKHAHCQT